MLFLPSCRFLRLLPLVIQNNLHPHRLSFPSVRNLSAFLIRVPHLLLDVTVLVWLFVLQDNVPVLVEYLSRCLLSFRYF